LKTFTIIKIDKLISVVEKWKLSFTLKAELVTLLVFRKGCQGHFGRYKRLPNMS